MRFADKYFPEKSINALVLGGWGHSPEVLKDIVPDKVSKIYFNYHDCENTEKTLERLREAVKEKQPDVVIGWSLGGKLAALAVSQGILNPELLVILGSSFKGAADTGLNNAAENFPALYEKDPEKAREALANTMLTGEKNIDDIRSKLKQDTEHDSDWLRWMQYARFGFDEVNFTNPPPTIIFHGEEDKLVPCYHADLFQKKIPGSTLITMKDCGHLPHLHAPEFIKEELGKKIKELGLTKPSTEKGQDSPEKYKLTSDSSYTEGITEQKIRISLDKIKNS